MGMLVTVAAVARSLTRASSSAEMRGSIPELVAIYIPACALTGAIIGAVQPLITTRMRAWLAGIGAAAPYIFAIEKLFFDPPHLMTPMDAHFRYFAIVLAGIVIGNLYWTEHLGRTEWD